LSRSDKYMRRCLRHAWLQNRTQGGCCCTDSLSRQTLCCRRCIRKRSRRNSSRLGRCMRRSRRLARHLIRRAQASCCMSRFHQRVLYWHRCTYIPENRHQAWCQPGRCIHTCQGQPARRLCRKYPGHIRRRHRRQLYSGQYRYTHRSQVPGPNRWGMKSCWCTRSHRCPCSGLLRRGRRAPAVRIHNCRLIPGTLRDSRRRADHWKLRQSRLHRSRHRSLSPESDSLRRQLSRHSVR
jgi:hypothetical protein